MADFAVLLIVLGFLLGLALLVAWIVLPIFVLQLLGQAKRTNELLLRMEQRARANVPTPLPPTPRPPVSSRPVMPAK